jgi:hypothetical protein
VDFATLLVIDRRKKPSVILLRSAHRRRVDDISTALIDVLERFAQQLMRGAIVTVRRQVRVRALQFVVDTREMNCHRRDVASWHGPDLALRVGGELEWQPRPHSTHGIDPCQFAEYESVERGVRDTAPEPGPAHVGPTLR